jgi:hypothetical protein
MRIGECLLFRLKWNQEISKILASEGELEELEDPVHTRRLVAAVEAEAKGEAADLLESCGKLTADHFTRIGNARIAEQGQIETRPQVEKFWSISYGIWPNERRAPRNRAWRMKAGVSIREVGPNQFFLLPWIWREGGPQGEEQLRAHLREKVLQDKSSELNWEEGQLALAKICLSSTGGGDPTATILQLLKDAVTSVTRQELENVYPA